MSDARPEATDCCICMGAAVRPAKIGQCNHSFCFQCIAEWLRRSFKCPTCRTDANSIFVDRTLYVLKNLDTSRPSLPSRAWRWTMRNTAVAAAAADDDDDDLTNTVQAFLADTRFVLSLYSPGIVRFPVLAMLWYATIHVVPVLFLVHVASPYSVVLAAAKTAWGIYAVPRDQTAENFLAATFLFGSLLFVLVDAIATLVAWKWSAAEQIAGAIALLARLVWVFADFTSVFSLKVGRATTRTRGDTPFEPLGSN